MKLTDAQTDQIADLLQRAGVDSASLLEDLLDHICTDIENASTDDFTVTLAEALKKFGGIPAIGLLQRQTRIALQHRTNIRRKALVYRMGYISAFILTVGVAFLLMKWPGATAILLSGIGVAVLLFLPTFIYCRHKHSQQDKLTL